jgi:hypothetical protein
MSTLESLLKDLEEKANAAAPGPWTVSLNSDDGDEAWVSGLRTGYDGEFDLADAEFLAAANPDTIKKLIAVIRLQKETIEKMNKALSEMNFYSMPATGTDYFTFKDQESNKAGEEVNILAKRHFEPFKNDQATSFLSALSKLRATFKNCEKIVSGT